MCLSVTLQYTYCYLQEHRYYVSAAVLAFMDTHSTTTTVFKDTCYITHPSLSPETTVCYINQPSLHFFLFSWSWVSPLCTSATILAYRKTDDQCEVVGRMIIGRGNRNTRRKPVPHRPPQIPHELAWVRTRSAAVGKRRLTVWAMARRENTTKITTER
jgi:hypothetical protein